MQSQCQFYVIQLSKRMWWVVCSVSRKPVIVDVCCELNFGDHNGHNQLLPDRRNSTFLACLLTLWFSFQADEISHVIAELEKSIARYKEEYAGLISQAQAIKADLAAVEAKVRVIADRIKPCHSRGRQANDEAQPDDL